MACTYCGESSSNVEHTANRLGVDQIVQQHRGGLFYGTAEKRVREFLQQARLQGDLKAICMCPAVRELILNGLVPLEYRSERIQPGIEVDPHTVTSMVAPHEEFFAWINIFCETEL